MNQNCSLPSSLPSGDYFQSLNREEPSVEPDIFFDEPSCDPGTPCVPLNRAELFLDVVERLLDLVHNKKEMQILRLRLRGMGYRQIASELRIGLASVGRFAGRIRRSSREIDWLMEYAPLLASRQQIPPGTENR